MRRAGGAGHGGLGVVSRSGAGGGGLCRGRSASPAQQPEPGAALMGVIGSGLWRGRSGPANAKQKLLTAVMARYGYDYCCNPQQQVLPGEPPGPGPGRADGAAPWDPERAPGAVGRPRRGVWGAVGIGVPLNSSRAAVTGGRGCGAGHGAHGTCSGSALLLRSGLGCAGLGSASPRCPQEPSELRSLIGRRDREPSVEDPDPVTPSPASRWPGWVLLLVLPAPPQPYRIPRSWAQLWARPRPPQLLHIPASTIRPYSWAG